jgi:hypothetical protein
MANDLQTMFEQLGPGAGAVEMAAQNMAADKEAASQQAYRQAQMADIMQRTSAAKDMAPLELEAKRTSNDVSKLKAAADRADYRSELVGRMIPLVEKAPPAARLALMKQYADENGLPMDESHLQHFAKIPADKLPEYLRTQRDNDIKNSEKYRQAWDVAEMQRKSAEKIASGHDAATRYGVDARAKAAEAKNKGIASIQENVRSGKMTAEKAAVALFGAAQFETDPDTKRQYEDMAKQYEQFAMNQRNAAAAGKVDVGAAANLPTQTLPPALGTPPAATPAAGEHSLTDVQKMYPGVNADQLRKAYKEKFGVDLK